MDRAYGVSYNQQCGAHGFLGTNRNHIMRSVGQTASWRACMRLVEQAELQDSRRYDWVIKTRSDLLWFGNHPHVCSLAAGYIHHHSVDAWIDHHFVLPRAVATTVISVVDAYVGCNHEFPFENVEKWFLGGVINATGVGPAGDGLPVCVELALPESRRNPQRPHRQEPSTHASSTAGVTSLLLPIYLVRKSALEDDAAMHVRRTCLPYSLLEHYPSLSAMCKTLSRLNADTKEGRMERRHVQRAFLTCMREAYPNDDVPDDFQANVSVRWWNGVLRNPSNCGPPGGARAV
jgi:hypothetical protein